MANESQLKFPETAPARVLVVGDVMLDRYWFGEVSRISPEAPVPVVKVDRIEERPGGAANVARNCAALGARVALLSVVGADEAGASLARLMAGERVEASLHEDGALSTTIKLRVIGRQQQLLRIDFENTPTHEVLRAKLDEYARRVRECDVVVLSDYGKGGLAHIGEMISLARAAGVPVLVDPKGDDYRRYAGATLLTPNRSEMREVVGRWTDNEDLSRRAQALRAELGLGALLVTRSEEGMSLFSDAPDFHEPARAREVFDVSGAGDTVIATLAVMLAAGCGLERAITLANRAAGIVVGKLGTAVCNRIELENDLKQGVSMYYIVTGAAGFIGSNLIRGLNARGIDRIIAVDNLSRADKFRNLVDCQIEDYLDKQDFVQRLGAGEFDGVVEAVFHQGACSDTMEQDGRYMMSNNYRYSVALLDYCYDQEVPLIYASSAAVYGGGHVFREERALEGPLNVYGYSKFLFDQVVRRRMADMASPVAGLRYFNVYGPNEQHKGRMASVAFHNFNQFRAEGRVKLFEGCDGYPNGGQSRDFIYVDDVVAVNLFFLDHPEVSGIFNTGTGRAQPFNDVAASVVNACRAAQGLGALDLPAMVAEGLIEYVDFPEALRGKYQSFTQADVGALRRAGFEAPFADVATGVGRYVTELLRRAG